MHILYGDDELVARDIVTKALTARGYQIMTLDTSRAEEMTTRLKTILKQYGIPAVFILDGHNILLDQDGKQLYDMTPLGLVSWLRQNGLAGDCKFILYSNDDKLIEQAKYNRALHFFDAVPKGGTSGGLTALIDAVGRATVNQLS